MNYVLSPHAQEQMRDRNITAQEVDGVLQSPQQIVSGYQGRTVYQSLIVKEGRIMLLRVIVVLDTSPAIVVSVYPTTDAKYWSQQ